MAENIGVIGTICGILASIYAFFKWFWPLFKSHVQRRIFIYESGVHVIMDIEREFGRNAGEALRKAMTAIHQKLEIKNIRLDILENLNQVGIFMADSEGEWTFTNKAIAIMFDTDQNNLHGKNWLQFMESRFDILNEYQFSISNKIPFRKHIRVKNTILEVQAEPAFDREVLLGYVGFIKVIQDPE